MLAQRTIRNKTSATGVGLHTGKKAVLTLHPADPDTGIIFRRIDGDKVIEMPAQANMVGNTTLATTLEKDGYEIQHEHLMSALAGLGVDNCIIDCDGPEIPIMEGSSTRFVFLVQAAGIVEQNAVKNLYMLQNQCKFKEMMQLLKLNLMRASESHLVLNLTTLSIKISSTASIDFSQTSYIRQVSRARTFGLYKELEC